MGCCTSSEAGAQAKPAARRALGNSGGKLRQASTGNISSNCSQGHPLEKYDVLDTLGTGGFAVVKKVRDKFTGENFAMKIISVNFDDATPSSRPSEDDDKEPMSAEEVMSEIETLRSLKHDAILDLKEYFVAPPESHVYVVTEILHGGAVLDAILRMKDERYTEAEAKVVVQRTLRGIDYLHKNLVVHRDLKLENLMLKLEDDLSSVVIVDFGLAKRCRDKKGSVVLPHAQGVDDSAVGTPVYAAPEVVEEKSYGAAVDMWSLGVIVYILVTGAMPRDLWKSALKYGRVAEADFGFDCYEWDTVSEAARDFVRRCLTHDPKRRLSAADALEHPWMKKVSNVRPAPLRIKSQLRDFAKGMKLPTRTYQKGDVLIKQGERATDEVFLIKSGKVNIVVTDHATGERVLVATRETGEFVGEMSVGSAALTRAESAGSGGARTSGGVEGSSKKKGSTSGKSGAPDSPSSMSSFQATLAAKIAGKKWVGKRRTADVVAATKVECLVLGRKEMEWAITHDETIKNELSKDIDARRVQTQAKLEKSKSAKEGRATKGTAPEDVDVAA